MHTINTIDIYGRPGRVRPRIYQLAADLQNWPTILPHYRYMRVTEQSERHKVADFGAVRSGLPVSWTAKQELFPQDFRITFLHIGGVTKGMWVEWTLEAKPDRVCVAISHELSYPVPILGGLFAKYVVGRLFVENIAGKTLRCIKDMVESEDRSAGF